MLPPSRPLPTAQQPSYAARLGSVLRLRDPRALQRFLVQSAERFGDQAQVDDVRGKSAAELEELLHHMILARADLGDLHAASRAWLSTRGRAANPAAHRRSSP